MRNIRELSIGSFVSFFQPNGTEFFGEVSQLRENIIGVKVVDIRKNDCGEDPEPEIKIGQEFMMPKGRINGIFIVDFTLKRFDFIESDEKAWTLMYYFGDMRIYYKFNRNLRLARFKFKPDFTQKTWIRIDCVFVHQLQNIMRFLTGGDLEFKYNNDKT